MEKFGGSSGGFNQGFSETGEVRAVTINQIRAEWRG